MESGHKIRIPRYGAVIAAIWSLLIAYSLLWDHRQHQEEALLLGKMQGQAFFEKDILYRRWASRHGGVYVPVTAATQPNPYLAHIPERDLVTPSGKQLTLVNPAYMTRQVFEIAQEYKGTGRGHITSLKPIREANIPDAWEQAALQSFEHGVTETGNIEQIDGKPYYRYMKAMKTDRPCLKCHAAQGYHEGDVRGGLSVSVSMAPVYAMMAKEMRGVYLNHSIIWLLGLGMIGLGTRKLDRITTRLYEKTVELELEVEERQVAQETLQEQTVILEEEIAERRQVEETVRISEEKFAKAFDNAPIMMTISRIEDGVYLDVNRKFSELSGFTRDEVLGSSSVDLGWKTPEQQQQLLAELRRGGSISGIELKLIAKGGKHITCIYYGESISVDGSQCLLSLLHNVTEHRLIEDQLRQSQKMEAIGQLAGGVAHDFNNILTVIMGYSTMLQQDQELGQEQREEVEQIISSAQKAAQLTRGLLTFSRKEAMELRLVNLNDVINHVQKFLIRIIGEDIQLKVTTNGKILVYADVGQIEQVLINLATNARDAMEKGGLLYIETGVHDIDDKYAAANDGATAGRYACISVSDTGKGMDEGACKKVFEPFYTTKEVGKGTGLGMAIVYGIIKQHHGMINVYSEPGYGTNFKIYLPVSEAEQALQVPQLETAVPQRGTETILVAEDEVAVRTLLKSILTSNGYTVILAENGQEAVDQFSAHRDTIKLILMDMIMPVKNGQEALGEITRDQPDIKAFYLSGYTADFIRSRGVNNEGIELITKPFQHLELLQKVRNMLDGITNHSDTPENC
jgi:PAS domain S-box-containing protein